MYAVLITRFFEMLCVLRNQRIRPSVDSDIQNQVVIRIA